MGNWRYVSGEGWRLDGTDLILDFDRLDRGGGLPGAYVLYTGAGATNPVASIDHYLRPAMEWVEHEYVAKGAVALR